MPFAKGSVVETIPRIGLAPVKGTCEGRFVVVPNCPEALFPQAQRVPSFLRSSECWLPEVSWLLEEYRAVTTLLGIALP